MKKYKKVFYIIGFIIIVAGILFIYRGKTNKEEIVIPDESVVPDENVVPEEIPIEEVPERTIVVCIDPGHYGGANEFYFQDGSSYCEGDTTLLIAIQLREILKQQYGIESYLTRETEHITLGGYTDAELDRGHISLRGEMAAGSDLFISLHTNANNDKANGYPTLDQPVAINKPILILNSVAREDEEILCTANLIGRKLTQMLAEGGLCTVEGFQENMDGTHLREWSEEYNDSINIEGTLCCRMADGQDYYGVLRGAADVGVPGIIVEHSFHTVSKVRECMANENLIQKLAQADADAIAEGFNIRKKQ